MELLERDPILAALQHMLIEVRHSGGRLALVAGEAGIGKTAVVEAFCRERRTGLPVLWGRCDGVDPPRPLAPVLDIASAGHGPLQAALDAEDRNAVFSAFLDLLRRGGSRIVVLEDLHWADEASLDLLRVVGRRLDDLPVLVIGTYRDHEVAPDHPLRLALGELPAGRTVTIPMPPLSLGALRTLTHGTGIDAPALHRLTGGNPFFATEVIAGADGALPVTIRDALLARTARLSPPAQDVVRGAAVIGLRCDSVLLHALVPAAETALEECVSRGLLEVEQGRVGFRHELAQRAILDALPPEQRAEWHRLTLASLRSMVPPAHPTELAHHAVRAGDVGAMLEFVPAAGDAAAVVGAHRQAAAHYAVALRHAVHVEPRQRARLLAAHAHECSLSDDLDSALASQEAVLAYWRDARDEAQLADALRAKSLLLWFAGQGPAAVEVAAEAVTLLERVAPGSPALASAFAALAQRHMVAGNDDDAMDWAQHAAALAEVLGEDAVAVHAQTTIGVLEVYAGRPAGWQRLQDNVGRAQAAGLTEETARCLINLVEAASDLHRFDLAERSIAEATAHLEPVEFDLFHRILRGRIADLEFERGRWDVAAAEARSLVAGTRTANRTRRRALVLLGRFALRRGDADAWPLLDEALATDGASDPPEMFLLHAARAEAAWFDGDATRAQQEVAAGLADSAVLKWHVPGKVELEFWGWKAGGRLPTGDASDPFVLHAGGRLREAAAAWRALGCPYQEGLALADSDGPGDLRGALAIFQRLGAAPMAKQVGARLHDLGEISIPRGPRPTTRNNPWRLTTREMEVLTLIGEGLANRDIARRLVLSPKTVDHHVSAVLRKVGVPDRGAAAKAAAAHAAQHGAAGPAT